MKKISRKLSLSVTLVSVIAFVCAGVAYASIPDSQNVIHACYRSSGLLANGQMRIIDSASQSCAGNETAITWNQTGPQGPAGPSGPGNVVSNRLSVPSNATDQQLMTLPGLGEIYANCNTSIGARWKFVNTSGQSVFINGQIEVLSSNSHTIDAPRDTFIFGLGDASNSTVATLTISQRPTSVPPQPCIYTALATVSSN
jgi:hypothetical protein